MKNLTKLFTIAAISAFILLAVFNPSKAEAANKIVDPDADFITAIHADSGEGDEILLVLYQTDDSFTAWVSNGESYIYKKCNLYETTYEGSEATKIIIDNYEITYFEDKTGAYLFDNYNFAGGCETLDEYYADQFIEAISK
ncbi:hypothetical protein QYZ88_004145 [Lachnospiraceae bacterium C1.1]|nr:hypothetical protein [Lachnospiraceae bacterium C1.1]